MTEICTVCLEAMDEDDCDIDIHCCECNVLVCLGCVLDFDCYDDDIFDASGDVIMVMSS